MNLNPVVDISRPQKKIFSLPEARFLMPVVRSMTRKASSQVQELIDRLDMINPDNEARVMIIEEQINKVIQTWQIKVEKLGLFPKGLWIVDFDAGNGYYCWKHPEKKLNHWHGYKDGFSNRICLEQKDKTI